MTTRLFLLWRPGKAVDLRIGRTQLSLLNMRHTIDEIQDMRIISAEIANEAIEKAMRASK